MTKIKGWKGIGPCAGQFVPYDEGFDYVARECGITMTDPTAPLAGEFAEEFVEWYFSGNWVEVPKGEDDDG